MEFQIVSAYENGWAWDIVDGERLVVRGSNQGSREIVVELLAQLRTPKQPDLKIKVEKAFIKGKTPEPVYNVRVYFKDDTSREIGTGMPQSKAACEADVAVLKSGALTSPEDHPKKPAKGKAAKATKASGADVATSTKQLVSRIADKSGIPKVDVQVVFDVLTRELGATLAAGEKLTLTGVGVFAMNDGAVTFKAASTLLPD